MKNKRIAAGIMAFCVLFIMLFSASFIAMEADHDCTGEDCPVCAFIAQCENTIHQICDGAGILMAVIVPVVFMLIRAFQTIVDFWQETLVSRKIRLNN